MKDGEKRKLTLPNPMRNVDYCCQCFFSYSATSISGAFELPALQLCRDICNEAIPFPRTQRVDCASFVRDIFMRGHGVINGDNVRSNVSSFVSYSNQKRTLAA